MPKGDNPNSRKNLIISAEELRKRASNGGKKSVEVRRRLKTFQELDAENTTDEERMRMLNTLKKMAEEGNVRAWEIYANYMGMKPAENIKVSAVTDDAVKDLKKAISKRRK